MFCPTCRAEYREGFTRCSDCRIELVERAPTAPQGITDEGDTGDFVLFEALDQFSAAQLCAFLEAHGIPARLNGPTVVNPYDAGGAAGIVEVLVPEELSRVARALQSRVAAGEFLSETTTEEPS